MTNIWNWSTTPASNNTADGNLWSEGQLPSTVNNSARDNMAAVAMWRDDISGKNVTTGSANAYVLTLATTSLTSLVDGVKVTARVNFTNTGPATLNVNSTGAKSIVKEGTTALAGDEQRNGGIYTWTYVLGSDHWRLHNPTLGTVALASGTIDDANNNTVTDTVAFTHTTSGTPGVGIGTGIQFVTETSAGNNEIGARIAAVTTDVTALSEDFDLRFYTMLNGATATESFRIDSSGRMMVGRQGAAASIGPATHRFEVAVNTNNDWGARIHGYGGFFAPTLLFSKTKNAAVGGHTAAAADDELGTINWYGSDGTSAFNESAFIKVHADAAHGVSDAPGRMSFWTTPDSAAIAVERMRINKDGLISLNTTNTTFAGGGATRLTIAHTPSEGGVPLRIASYGSDGFGPGVFSTYTRHASDINGAGIVQSGDELFAFDVRGNDGVNFRRAAYISVQVDGTPGVNDMPGRLMFFTTPDGSVTVTERLRIDQAGRFGINTRGAVPNTLFNFQPGIVSAASSANNGDIALNAYLANTDASSIYFAKSRHATIGSHTVVQQGDTLGEIYFGGSDGTDWAIGAKIAVLVGDTPGNDDMPANIAFWTTPDNFPNIRERMRIDFQGRISYSAGATLTIAAGVLGAPLGRMVTIDTEAAAATDDLDTIGTTGVATWTEIVIKAADDGRTVVVKDGTGNIRSAGDFSLTHSDDRMVLQYNGTNWIELSRSDNTA